MLTGYDHQMFQVAAQRGEVIVNCDGRQRLAILIAWRPRRRPNSQKRPETARVEFSTGSRCTVPCDSVRVPDSRIVNQES